MIWTVLTLVLDAVVVAFLLMVVGYQWWVALGAIVIAHVIFGYGQWVRLDRPPVALWESGPTIHPPVR